MFPVIPVGNLFEIPVYGILFMAGVLAAAAAGRRMGPQAGISGEDIIYGAVYAFIGILIGSKAVYLFTRLPSLLSVIPAVRAAFRQDAGAALLYVVNYLLGGYVYYGGLLGAAAGVYCYCRQYRVAFVSYMDVFAPLIPFVHGIGRVGCFLAGCCYGVEYHGIGSVRFPENKLIPGLDEVPRVPVQLMEAGCNFICFGVMMFLFYKKRLRGGRLLGIYLLYYSAARFALEFLRGDGIRGNVGIFSTSQLISLVLIPAGIFLAVGGLERRHR